MREIWRVVLEKRMLSTKMEVDNLINVKVAITVVRGGGSDGGPERYNGRGEPGWNWALVILMFRYRGHGEEK